MRVCFIATEIFSQGIFGGFGAITRSLAKGLSERGLDICVIMPRQKGQKPLEVTDNFIVVSYPGQSYSGWNKSRGFKHLFEAIDADIYHSEEPSVGTHLALLGSPGKKHIITFQDPRTLKDRKREWIEAGTRGFSLVLQHAEMRFAYSKMKNAVRKADRLFIQAKYAAPKAMRIYGLKKPPHFLPCPVTIPTGRLIKSDQATVCFLGRWDPRKRPEYFFELARRFPEVKFISMGGCQPHFSERESKLMEKIQDIPNLEITGWTFGEEKSRILEKSWILINTSWRECLPRSYIEACAYKCAILSHENPDDFAANFGFWAQKGDIEDFAGGLEHLLLSNRWKELGERGYAYVKDTFEYDKVIEDHIRIYEDLLQS
ncbi:MAG: glycosyltransferase family 4 protein [Candidatus Aminicenantes bacterium]|nr:glycosyltransferase family 4 protein [Candidatus Aminicenantes bacterium]